MTERTPSSLPPAWEGAVLGVCGYKNSGKTTLIEALVHRLREDGLSCAVIKHDAHGFEADRPGKDSDRFFRAGADVVLQGPGETFSRTHEGENTSALLEWIAHILPRHDVVLVEGHKDTPLPRIWLEGSGPPPGGPEAFLQVLPPGPGRVSKVYELLMGRLEAGFRGRELLGCLLAGGRSRRMGRAKQLLERNGTTWAEHAVDLLRSVTRDVVVAGGGTMPGRLASLPRLADAREAPGPLGGLLAAIRWAPRASWLFLPCDMPHLTEEALRWFLDERRAGTWALMSTLGGRNSPVEPLPLYLDFRGGPLLETLAREGRHALFELTRHPRVRTAAIPPALRPAWRNLNTPEDLEE